jgi:ATP-binding cassette, subfamily B, bacterial PglK
MQPYDASTSRSGSSSDVLRGGGDLLLGTGRLWGTLSKRRRRQFLLLVLLMLVGTAAELVSIGVVFPFLVALTSPAALFEGTRTGPLLATLGVRSAQDLMLALTVAVIGAVALSNAVRLFVNYLSVRYGYAIGTDLSSHMFRNALYRPYVVQVSTNSSELISGIMVKTSAVVHGVLMPMLLIANAGLVLTLSLAALLWRWPWFALAVVVLAFAVQALLSWGTARALAANSRRIADGSTHAVKALQEGLGGIRDVLLDGSQEVHARAFERSDRVTRRAQADNAALGAVPRYVLEFLGVAALVGVAYALARSTEGVATAVPTLGLLAMAAQRLLPYLQQALSAWIALKGNRAVLEDALALLAEPADRPALDVVEPLTFARDIELRDVGFRYDPSLPRVLNGVTCTFQRGKRYGLIGSTGSGKSTCLDVLMGLLPPTEGQLRVDGVPVEGPRVRAWQARQAHVPQAIFLADASIEENIALGVPRAQIDRALLHDAARRAQIHDAIEAMPQGYATLVGERGVRLSGGQRQRIGIARALYKRADVILLDEATSALDTQTEAAVAEAIHELGPDVTLFIVAHRLSTLQHCDEVLEFADGRILRLGPYASVVGDAAAMT